MTSTPIATASRTHPDASGIPASSRWLSAATPPDQTQRVIAAPSEIEAKITENLIELAEA